MSQMFSWHHSIVTALPHLQQHDVQTIILQDIVISHSLQGSTKQCSRRKWAWGIHM